MTKQELCAEIRRFLNTRPGFEYGNYGSRAAYFADVRSATNQRSDALDMLAVIERSDTITVDDMIRAMPSRLTLYTGPVATRTSAGLLTEKATQLEYCAGQYYCVEYRRAVASWLSSVLWDYYREHCGADTREKIQRAAHLAFRSRRVRGYFA